MVTPPPLPHSDHLCFMFSPLLGVFWKKKCPFYKILNPISVKCSCLCVQFSSDITFWRHAEGSLKQGCLVDLVIAPTVWLLSRDHSGLLKLTRFDKHGKRRSNPGEEEELDEKVRQVWAAVTPCGKIKPELASTSQRANFLDLSNVTTDNRTLSNALLVKAH